MFTQASISVFFASGTPSSFYKIWLIYFSKSKCVRKISGGNRKKSKITKKVCRNANNHKIFIPTTQQKIA